MFHRLVQIHLEQCSLFFLRTWKVGDDARSRIGEHQVQPRKHYRMNRGKVAGVFMRGPLAGSRAALQDCLWNLPDERNNEGRGTLQRCNDHTCVVHETSCTNVEEIIDCLTPGFQPVRSTYRRQAVETLPHLNFAPRAYFCRIEAHHNHFGAGRWGSRTFAGCRRWVEKGDEHSTQWQE